MVRRSYALTGVSALVLGLAISLPAAAQGGPQPAPPAADNAPPPPPTVDPVAAQPPPPAPQFLTPPPPTAPVAPAEDHSLNWHASLADGVGIKTANDIFSLDVGILNQMRFDMTFNGGKLDETGFNVNIVRPQIKARAFHDKVRFFFQPEMGTASPKLLDLEVTWQPLPEVGVKVGQFVTPFSRTFLTPVPALQFTDFSRVNVKFRADRDTGAMFLGSTGKGKLEYYLGAFNGNTIDKNGNDDKSIMGIGRLAINPVRPVAYDETPSLKGDVPFGVAIAFNGIADRAHPTKTQTDPTTGATTLVAGTPETRLTGGGDLYLAAGRFTFLAEGYLKQVSPDTGSQTRSYGFFAQSGFFVVPKHFEVAARVGYMDPNTSKDKDTETSFEGLLNGYVVGNHLKMGLRYQYLHLDSTPAAATPVPGNGVDGLKAGANHRVIAHLQFWI